MRFPIGESVPLCLSGESTDPHHILVDLQKASDDAHYFSSFVDQDASRNKFKVTCRDFLSLASASR